MQLGTVEFVASDEVQLHTACFSAIASPNE